MGKVSETTKLSETGFAFSHHAPPGAELNDVVGRTVVHVDKAEDADPLLVGAIVSKGVAEGEVVKGTRNLQIRGSEGTLCANTGWVPRNNVGKAGWKGRRLFVGWHGLLGAEHTPDGATFRVTNVPRFGDPHYTVTGGGGAKHSVTLGAIQSALTGSERKGAKGREGPAAKKHRSASDPSMSAEAKRRKTAATPSPPHGEGAFQIDPEKIDKLQEMVDNELEGEEKQCAPAPIAVNPIRHIMESG